MLLAGMARGHAQRPAPRVRWELGGDQGMGTAPHG